MSESPIAALGMMQPIMVGINALFLGNMPEMADNPLDLSGDAMVIEVPPGSVTRAHVKPRDRGTLAQDLVMPSARELWYQRAKQVEHDC